MPPAQMTKKAVKQLSKPKGKPVKMIYIFKIFIPSINDVTNFLRFFYTSLPLVTHFTK